MRTRAIFFAAAVIALAALSAPRALTQTAALTPAEAERQLEDLRAQRAQATGNRAWDIDSRALRLLVQYFPYRTSDIEQAIDGLAAAPAGSSSLRLATFADAVSPAVARKVGLAAIARGMTGALAGLTRDAVAADLSLRPTVVTPSAIDAEYASHRLQALDLLGRVHLELHQLDKADDELREAIALSPALPSAHLALAEIEQARGHDRAALDHYLVAQLLSVTLDRETETKALTLYRNLHGGSDAGLAAEAERAFVAAMPAPIKPARYVAGDRLAGRVPVVELVTGSGCFPCVAADFAFDALIERYPAGAIAPLAYHANAPAPDPMAIPASDALLKYLSARSGVPQMIINGTGAYIGGGNRLRTQVLFEEYTGAIDRALASAPEATLALRARRDGNQITVDTTISGVTAALTDLQLHVVLAERELHFHGENGVHAHAMVVRAVAGDPATGVPVSVGSSGKGSVTQRSTFDLASIGDGVAKYLESTIASRRAMSGDTRPRQTYKAQGQAQSTIDPAALVIVAYVSAPDKHVLQAATVNLSSHEGQ